MFNGCLKNWSVDVLLSKIIYVKLYHMPFNDFFKIKIDNVMSIKSILTDNVKIVTLDTFLRVQTLEFIVMWLDFSCAYHRPKNYNVILG